MLDDVGVRDDFLSLSQVRSLVECAQRRRDRGEFRPARIGSHLTLQTRADIRGDSTCWLAEPLFPPEHALLEAFESLRLGFNREAFLGLFDLELHYAWYPPGASYARHVDHPCGRELRRRMSVALYLNEDWRPAAGGELRIYGGDQGHRDIAPIAGRLVHFLSANREHAVLPTHRDRLSISGWFSVRA